MISFLMVLGGLILLTFNKKIGLFIYEIQPENVNYFLLWHPRINVLILGIVLIIAGCLI